MEKEAIKRVYAEICDADFYKDENQEMHILINTKFDSFDIPPADFHLIEEDNFVQVEHHGSYIKIYLEDIVSIDYFLSEIF